MAELTEREILRNYARQEVSQEVVVPDGADVFDLTVGQRGEIGAALVVALQNVLEAIEGAEKEANRQGWHISVVSAKSLRAAIRKAFQ